MEERTAELHEAVSAAEAAIQARNEFLAGMNHELRTPLNAIIGNAALLQGRTLRGVNARLSATLS